MKASQSSYDLSPEADNDLEEIYDYSDTTFGSDQAISYLEGLETLFENLSKHPHIGRLRPEIRKGLRSIAHSSHTVYYRTVNKRIRIVRVLHSSRDLPNYLKGE
jgi:toxin ParE1/3/4